MITRISADVCYAIGHPTQHGWRLHTYEAIEQMMLLKWTTNISHALVFPTEEKAETFKANYLSDTTVTILEIVDGESVE